MALKAAFNIQLQGFPQANRDAEVTLVNQSTGSRFIRKPFLDGQLIMRDLEPGPYEISVRHPNLIEPIDRRVVRLFPQPFPTRVPVVVRPELFRDTPIRDIPDADLSPVQQAATTVKETLSPLGTKSPGETIRSSDWNALVGAMTDLAGAVLELTQLVSPIGHDHPEIAEKTAEIQGNIRRFTESFGRSLLELRRDIESQQLRRNLLDTLDRAGAPTEIRNRWTQRIDDLEEAIQQPTPVWTGKLSRAGNAFIQEVNELAVAQGAEGDSFLKEPVVQSVMLAATQYANVGTQVKAEDELQTYMRTTSTSKKSKFSWAQR